MSFKPDRYTNRLVIPAGLIFVLVIAAIVMAINNQELLKKAEAAVFPHFNTLKKYPNTVYLPAVDVLGPDGGVVNLRRDFRGQLLVLNVWATWCTPCVRELPELKRLRTARQLNKVQVISVSIDLPKNVDQVLSFTRKYDVADVAGYHDYYGQLQASLPMRNLPVTYIISSRGVVLYEITGEARWSRPEVIDFIAFISTIY